MNKIILGSLFASATLISSAFANEVEAGCQAYAAAHGSSDSGCSCLAEAAEGNDDLVAALMAITTPAELDAASDDTKAAIGACFPEG